MTTRTGCTQTLLSSDYIFFFHQRNRVFDCLLFGQAALVFSEFIFNRLRLKKTFREVIPCTALSFTAYESLRDFFEAQFGQMIYVCILHLEYAASNGSSFFVVRLFYFFHINITLLFGASAWDSPGKGCAARRAAI